MDTLLWEKVDGPYEDTHKARCLACMHHCVMPNGTTGICGVRQNVSGHIESLVTTGIVSAHADPVEKKPLYHYLPGTRTYSFGTEGCNFSCSFCQNAEISQHPRLSGHVREKAATPEMLVRAAMAVNCASIAFTYTEPTVFIELAAAVASQALDRGLGTIMVSNGYQTPETLLILKPLVQAANIDLKSMNPDFYRTFCGAKLQPVLDNLKRMTAFGWWIEVTTLVIPGQNDTPDELGRIARFIRSELGHHVPWHVSAFHPAFRMQHIPSTPPSTIDMACAVGQEEGLSFVYPGNVAPDAIKAGRSTPCPACGTICIDRPVTRTLPFDGACPQCGVPVPGRWRAHSK